LFEVTVKSGEDIKETIVNFILEHQWEEAYISGAVGSVIHMAFTTPLLDTLPLKTTKQTVEGAAEVLSFVGEVMKREYMDPALESVYPDKDSPLFVHIHVACAYRGGKVTGGGLAAGKAFRTLRIFLTPIERYEGNTL
jgi:predicted DNA-binding protein with PD1-like motif